MQNQTDQNKQTVQDQFVFTANYDNGNLRNIKQLQERPQYFPYAKLQQQNSYYFEFESKCDNEGTSYIIPDSWTHFNFCFRLSNSNQQLLTKNFDEFFNIQNIQYVGDIEKNNEIQQRPILRNFYFIWKNSISVKKLEESQMHCVYRIFDNVLYQTNQELPMQLQKYQQVIPSPLIYTFSQTNQVVIPKDSKIPLSWFSFSCYLQPHQIVQVCYCYTYSLSNIYADMLLKPYFGIKELTKSSIEQLPVYAFEFAPLNIQSKQCVVLSARVHPGESLQSYVLNWVVDQLIIQQRLKDTWIYVVPCLNPDGVYNGNYRFDCLKQNLNRIYDKAAKHSINEQYNEYAPITAFIDLISQLKQANMQIKQIIDFHCHATIKSFIIFGNDLLSNKISELEIDKNKLETYFKSQQHLAQSVVNQQNITRSKTPSLQYKNLIEKMPILNKAKQQQMENLLFQYYLFKNSIYLNLERCQFSDSNTEKADIRGESMQGSMRIQMLKLFDLQNVYTLEINYGVNKTSDLIKIVDLQFLQQISKSIATSIVQFCEPADSQQRQQDLEQVCTYPFATQYLQEDFQ